MGATVSICNFSTVILNVALIQVTPIYYENQLPIGKCVDFNVGRVWFTLEATTWLNGHEYELEKDLVRPILDLSFETVKDASSVKDIETTRTALNHLFDKMSNLTKKVPPGIPEALRSRITGVFMNRNRKFKVVGGPNATDVVIDKEDLSQSINMPDQPFDPIRIIEIKNYA